MMQVFFIQIIILVIHSAFLKEMVFGQIERGNCCHFNGILADNGKSVEKVLELKFDITKNNSVKLLDFQSIRFYSYNHLKSNEIYKGNTDSNLHQFLWFESGVSPPIV